MKKVLAITICFLMVLSASSFATKTRVQTMGDNNMIMVDEANIWLFPGRLFQFPDMAVAEFGNYEYYYDAASTSEAGGYSYYGGERELGIHWKFGTEKPFVIGTYVYDSDGQTDGQQFVGDGFPYGLNNEFYYWGLFNYSSSYFGYVPYNSPIGDYSNRRIGLFYSRQLSGYNFGFYFDKLHNSRRFEDSDGNTYDNVSFSRYTFGFGLTEAAGMWDVSAKVALYSWKDKGWDGTAEADRTKPSGNYMFDIMGRYFYQYNPTITFVPHAQVMLGQVKSEDFYNNSYGSGFQTENDVYKANLTLFAVGSGMHYTPSAGMLAVLDAGFVYTKFKFEETYNGGTEAATYEENYTITTLPYVKVGFEGEVLSWMDVRFGATTYWRNFTAEYTDDGEPDGKDMYRYPNNMTYLGFSFNWGNLTVDTWTDPELFLQGLNFISGGNTRMNGGISALYNF